MSAPVKLRYKVLIGTCPSVINTFLKGTMETSEGGVNVAQLNHGLDAGDFGLSHAMQVDSVFN